MVYNFSDIQLLPLTLATLFGLGLDTLWRRFYIKQKKNTLLIILFRLIALMVLSLGVSLLTLLKHQDLILHVKQNIWTCLIFVAPCLALQTLDTKQDFTTWFIQVMYYVSQLCLLTMINYGILKLMNG